MRVYTLNGTYYHEDIHKYLAFVSTFHCMKKYPAIDTESRMRFAVSQKDIYMLCIYTWGFQITLKKKVSHNDMTSYCHQHIVCNYGGGKNLKFHSPLSWQHLLIYFVLCLFLFLFICTKSLKNFHPSTSSVTDIKMRVSSRLLSVSYSIVLYLPFFLSLLYFIGCKRAGKSE